MAKVSKISSLFKSKAEQRAYAKGRRDQYNKEHPLTNWVVKALHHSFNEDGTPYGKPYSVDGSRHKSLSKAKEAVRAANEREKFRKERVLEAVRKKKVNVYNSYDSTYTEFVLKKEKKRL